MLHLLTLFHLNQNILSLIHLKPLHSCFKLILLINYFQKFPFFLVDFSSNLLTKTSLYKLCLLSLLELLINFQYFTQLNIIQVQSFHYLFESTEILNLPHFSFSDFHFANKCPYQVKIHC